MSVSFHSSVVCFPLHYLHNKHSLVLRVLVQLEDPGFIVAAAEAVWRGCYT